MRELAHTAIALFAGFGFAFSIVGAVVCLVFGFAKMNVGVILLGMLCFVLTALFMRWLTFEMFERK